MAATKVIQWDPQGVQRRVITSADFEAVGFKNVEDMVIDARDPATKCQARVPARVADWLVENEPDMVIVEGDDVAPKLSDKSPTEADAKS